MKSFLGSPSTFREAFPNIDTISVICHQSGDIDTEYLEDISYNKENIVHKIQCANNRCREGGINLDNILKIMYLSKKTFQEVSYSCTGYEQPYGRGNHKSGLPCCNSFKVTIKITYLSQ